MVLICRRYMRLLVLAGNSANFEYETFDEERQKTFDNC